MIKVKDKFYVGSKEIGSTNMSGWASPTIQQAIEKAKRQLEENEHQQEAIVVQIVLVVRRQTTPLMVEKVI